MASHSQHKHFPFLALPLELRFEIYDLCLIHHTRNIPDGVEHSGMKWIDLNLLRVNKQIHLESSQACAKLNKFIHLITDNPGPIRCAFRQRSILPLWDPVHFRSKQQPQGIGGFKLFSMRVEVRCWASEDKNLTHIILVANPHLEWLGAAIAWNDGVKCPTPNDAQVTVQVLDHGFHSGPFCPNNYEIRLLEIVRDNWWGMPGFSLVGITPQKTRLEIEGVVQGTERHKTLAKYFNNIKRLEEASTNYVKKADWLRVLAVEEESQKTTTLFRWTETGKGMLEAEPSIFKETARRLVRIRLNTIYASHDLSRQESDRGSYVPGLHDDNIVEQYMQMMKTVGDPALDEYIDDSSEDDTANYELSQLAFYLTFMARRSVVQAMTACAPRHACRRLTFAHTNAVFAHAMDLENEDYWYELMAIFELETQLKSLFGKDLIESNIEDFCPFFGAKETETDTDHEHCDWQCPYSPAVRPDNTIQQANTMIAEHTGQTNP